MNTNLRNNPQRLTAALAVVLTLELLFFNTFWPLTLLLLTALLLFQHRSNIQKLLK